MLRGGKGERDRGGDGGRVCRPQPLQQGVRQGIWLLPVLLRDQVVPASDQ
jgi:hypothetical protein